MKKVLLIDAAARQNSRTRALALYLSEKIPGEVTHLRLYDAELPQLDGERLRWRDACCAAKDFEDEYFDTAKQFAEADILIAAAPYWDFSFPAVLKQYIETVSVNGITFVYSEKGVPVGLCAAERLYYVTTSGGPVFDDSFGYGYVSGLFRTMFGIKDAVCIKAEGLDVDGADIDSIMDEARNAIDALVSGE